MRGRKRYQEVHGFRNCSNGSIYCLLLLHLPSYFSLARIVVINHSHLSILCKVLLCHQDGGHCSRYIDCGASFLKVQHELREADHEIHKEEQDMGHRLNHNFRLWSPTYLNRTLPLTIAPCMAQEIALHWFLSLPTWIQGTLHSLQDLNSGRNWPVLIAGRVLTQSWINGCNWTLLRLSSLVYSSPSYVECDQWAYDWASSLMTLICYRNFSIILPWTNISLKSPIRIPSLLTAMMLLIWVRTSDSKPFLGLHRHFSCRSYRWDDLGWVHWQLVFPIYSLATSVPVQLTIAQVH